MSSPPGPLSAARAELVQILATGGIRAVRVGERWVSPVALLESNDHYVEPASLGGDWKTATWTVWLVGGAGDAAASFAAADDLLERALLALGHAQGWSSPAASGSRLTRIVGVEGGYIASRMVAATIVDLSPEV